MRPLAACLAYAALIGTAVVPAQVEGARAQEAGGKRVDYALCVDSRLDERLHVSVGVHPALPPGFSPSELSSLNVAPRSGICVRHAVSQQSSVNLSFAKEIGGDEVLACKLETALIAQTSLSQRIALNVVVQGPAGRPACTASAGQPPEAAYFVAEAFEESAQ